MTSLYLLLKILQKCKKVQEKQNQRVHLLLDLTYQAQRESRLNWWNSVALSLAFYFEYLLHCSIFF